MNTIKIIPLLLGASLSLLSIPVSAKWVQDYVCLQPGYSVRINYNWCDGTSAFRYGGNNFNGQTGFIIGLYNNDSGDKADWGAIYTGSSQEEQVKDHDLYYNELDNGNTPAATYRMDIFNSGENNVCGWFYFGCQPG